MNFEPKQQTSERDPYPVYRELRDTHPLYRCKERELWVLSRFADVRAVLCDPGVLSSASGIVPSGFVPEKPLLIMMDPPRHDAVRAVVQRAFTPRRIRLLEASVRSHTQRLVDALPSGGEVDLIEAFASPLPIYVISDLVGVEIENREMFKRCSDELIHGSDPQADSMLEAQRELFDYLERKVSKLRERPGDDLLSVLLDASAEGGSLAPDDVLGFCYLLLLAGTETTTSALGNAITALHEFPVERERLARDPSLGPTAVEELLRFDSPVQGISRTLLREVQLHGQRIDAGERVHVLLGAANRDERVFAEPDRLDLGRAPNHHLAFGFGLHFCLGRSLARLELGVALEALLARAPDYALATDDCVRVEADINRGFTHLPARLG